MVKAKQVNEHVHRAKIERITTEELFERAQFYLTFILRYHGWW